MIQIKVGDKVFDFQEGEIEVYRTNDLGESIRLDAEKEEPTNWDDVREIIRHNRERVVAPNIYG